MSDMAWQVLQPAINLGLEEDKFWNMTLAEVGRWIDGASWRHKSKAQYDYILADLIGRSIARVISDEATMPDIEDVYPNLFEKKQAVEETPQRDLNTIKSVNNFMARAMAINAAKRKSREKDGGEQK